MSCFTWMLPLQSHISDSFIWRYWHSLCYISFRSQWRMKACDSDNWCIKKVILGHLVNTIIVWSAQILLRHFVYHLQSSLRHRWPYSRRIWRLTFFGSPIVTDVNAYYLLLYRVLEASAYVTIILTFLIIIIIIILFRPIHTFILSQPADKVHNAKYGRGKGHLMSVFTTCTQNVLSVWSIHEMRRIIVQRRSQAAR